MPETDLHRLLYVSSAVSRMPPAALESLLTDARARNGSNGITGLLLYADGDFMQLLEGPRDQVLDTYSRIERSRLHRGLIALMNSSTKERIFSGWSMAYSQATWGQLTEVQNACRQSDDAVAKVLRGFAGDASRFPLGKGT